MVNIVFLLVLRSAIVLGSGVGDPMFLGFIMFNDPPNMLLCVKFELLRWKLAPHGDVYSSNGCPWECRWLLSWFC